jgi:hypothetical protein
MSPASAILELLLWHLVGGGESKTPGLPSYVDRADEVGLSFLHRDGRSGRKYLLETLGSGVALFDYDNDGWLDVYCVNGADLPGSSSSERPRNALFRGRGDGTFEDVTARSGTGHAGYGFGCAAADYDGDGLVDIYVTNFGDDVLYRNRGDGTFEDVTRRAGVSSPAWTTGAAFLDADGDGDLDLYVASYVEYAVTDSPDICRLGNVLAYCHPKRYRGAPDFLYRNNGDGTFTDVATAAGLGRDEGKGLGVICGDYDNDGDQDIFVANDTTPNFLYQNQGGGRFREIGLVAGVAYGDEGKAQSGMGVELADYDGDGWLDFAVTNFTRESNSLYRNHGAVYFSECSYASGTGSISFPFMGWGTRVYDFDDDGLRDWFVVNGHLQDNVEEIEPGFTYAQRNLLFRNAGKGRFIDLGPAAGPAMDLHNAGRGAAFGDLDNDGDIDVVISTANSRLRYLRRDGATGNHWASLTLRQTGPNAFAIGARATVRAGGLSLVDEVRAGGSYLSQNDTRLHFGLGPNTKFDLEVRWPDGGVTAHTGLPADRLLRLDRGR